MKSKLGFMKEKTLEQIKNRELNKQLLNNPPNNGDLPSIEPNIGLPAEEDVNGTFELPAINAVGYVNNSKPNIISDIGKLLKEGKVREASLLARSVKDQSSLANIFKKDLAPEAYAADIASAAVEKRTDQTPQYAATKLGVGAGEKRSAYDIQRTGRADVNDLLGSIAERDSLKNQDASRYTSNLIQKSRLESDIKQMLRADSLAQQKFNYEVQQGSLDKNDAIVKSLAATKQGLLELYSDGIKSAEDSKDTEAKKIYRKKFDDTIMELENLNSSYFKQKGAIK